MVFMVELVDKVLTCIDCQGEFILSIAEQVELVEKGYYPSVTMCRPCRVSWQHCQQSAPAPELKMYQVHCSDCGRKGEVPVMPAQGKPTYCEFCFTKRKLAAGTEEV